MSSGVTIADEVVDMFTKMKLEDKKHRYLIFRLSDNMTEIIVDKAVEKDLSKSPEEEYEAFQTEMFAASDKQQCRYAVYDFEFNGKTKLVFILWSHDQKAAIKQKMVYTSSKDALKKKLSGIGTEVQANDEEEMSFKTIGEKLAAKDRAGKN